MKFPAAIGRVFPGFVASTGRLGLFAAMSVSHCVTPRYPPRPIWRRVADDNLHPSGNLHGPWADTLVPLVKSALLMEETP